MNSVIKSALPVEAAVCQAVNRGEHIRERGCNERGYDSGHFHADG